MVDFDALPLVADFTRYNTVMLWVGANGVDSVSYDVTLQSLPLFQDFLLFSLVALFLVQ